MEAAKGFVFGRGEAEIDGTKVHTYLVSLIISTSEPLELVNPVGETVVMGTDSFGTPIADAVQRMIKYKPPYPLGDASHAILLVSEMDPDNLEEVGTKRNKERRKTT